MKGHARHSGGPMHSRDAVRQAARGAAPNRLVWVRFRDQPGNCNCNRFRLRENESESAIGVSISWHSVKPLSANNFAGDLSRDGQ